MRKNFTFQEIASPENILNVLKQAKDIYLYRTEPIPVFGMCKAIQMAFEELNDITPNEEFMLCLIPEFNKNFCNAKLTNNKSIYWWKLDNKNARISSFDKLIKYYEHKQK